MSIYEKAQEWLKEPAPDNGEPELEVIASAREIILGLMNENDTLSQNVCGECSPDNYGWVENRVEGRAVCGCIQEAEPFQILLKALEKLACLGNGDQFGNSDGNCIAIAALRSVLPLEYGKSV